ncbi:ASCH domain-containing protein [Gracilibacillus sp. HCP3S3_G5_1]|uniref:ASCH domain-containing protein n=1 Tax=unclassified Gracilibacillus TaxID=2625209 RepID=UPI003F8C2C2C
MSNREIEEYWQAFKKVTMNAPDTYDTWPFGATQQQADDLAQLVLKGKKTATSSAYKIYQDENEALPYVGLYNIILNGNNLPVAILKTIEVTIVPFNEVTEEHAFLEGEGDRSLSYWREVHQDFFEMELKTINQSFNENILVVCERFELVHPK